MQWFVQPTAAWIADDTNKSFIFSLTNADKFNLTKKEQTIYRHTDNVGYGPTFGSGHDIRIVNKSHEANCSAAIGACYTNANYEADAVSY